MQFSNSRKLLISGVALGLSAFLAVGCSGGDSGGFSGTSGGGSGGNNNNNSGGSTPAAPALARVSVKGIAPAGTPGATTVAFRDFRGPVEMLLSLVSSPAFAASGDVVLSGFTVTAYGPTGAVAGTAVADANGDVTFANLPPGNYRYVFTNPTYPNTQLQILVPVAAGSSPTVTANNSTTAAALIAILDAGGPNNLGGIDAAVYNSQATTNPAFLSVANSISTSLVNNTPFATASGTITDPALATAASTAANSILTVIGQYPTQNQQNVPRVQTPIFVTFSDAMDVATIPPNYTGWQVQHTSPSTGVSVTVTPANLSAYGTWSYSNSARTVSGINVPAHSLLFTHSQTLAASAQEQFTWQFNALPKSSSGVTVTTSAQAGTANSWVFYTAP